MAELEALAASAKTADQSKTAPPVVDLKYPATGWETLLPTHPTGNWVQQLGLLCAQAPA